MIPRLKINGVSKKGYSRTDLYDPWSRYLPPLIPEKKVTAVRTVSGDPKKVTFTLPNIGVLDTVKEIVAEDFPNLEIDIQSEEGSFPRIFLSLSSEEIAYIEKNAVTQSLEIIRNRIDQFGVSEPVIIRQGEDEIVVQLPGVKDSKRALSLIGQTAQLEFKMLDEESALDPWQLIIIIMYTQS